MLRRSAAFAGGSVPAGEPAIEFAADGTVVRIGTVEAATTRGADEAVQAWVAQAKGTTP